MPVPPETGRFLLALVAPNTGCELIEGDSLGEVAALDDSFDLVFIDAADRFYEQLFQLVRPKLDLGALVVADNVLSRPEHLAAYTHARQTDPTLESVTVPVGEGLELSVVLTDPL